MKTLILRGLVVLLILGVGLFRAGSAHAQITCSSANMGALTFSSVNPLSSQTSSTATFTYTCQNSSSTRTYSATVCFSIGEPNAGPTSPRLMSSGASTLKFDLYQDASHTVIWGSQWWGSNTPLMVNMTLSARQSTTNTATLYGMVYPNQATAIPGTYADNYTTVDTATTVNYQQGTTAPGSCGGTGSSPFFAFNVTAAVQKVCTVSADPVLNLGSVAAGSSASSGSVNLYVACSNTTPYHIGLQPLSSAATDGSGIMKGGTSGNTNTVGYQLYQNAALTTAWGNTATVTSAGNGISGTGTGSQRNPAPVVYAKATTTTDVQPDTYTDTVQIDVYY